MTKVLLVKKDSNGLQEVLKLFSSFKPKLMQFIVMMNDIFSLKFQNRGNVADN